MTTEILIQRIKNSLFASKLSTAFWQNLERNIASTSSEQLQKIFNKIVATDFLLQKKIEENRKKVSKNKLQESKVNEMISEIDNMSLLSSLEQNFL